MATKNGKKDPRYKVIKIMLAAGAIKSFKEIFTHLPKSVVAKDLRTNNNRMTKLIDEPADFTFKEIDKIAGMIGCDSRVLHELVVKAR